MNTSDRDLVVGVYRLQKLIQDTPGAAREKTSTLCDFFRREDVFAVCDAEDEGREKLLTERARINRELGI
jgi:hypothetical protein